MNRLKITVLFFCFIVMVSLIVGCSLSNTPTSRVEEMFSHYQMLDKNIDISYTLFTNDAISDEAKKRYEEILRKQYRNLVYEIKDEKIDGDKAVVEVEIEVDDFSKIFSLYNKNDYSIDEYHELVLDDMEQTKDRVVYQLNIDLEKDENDEWQVMDLSSKEKNKILGIYS